MKKLFRYIWYVTRHKWYVAIECFKRGIVWRGLVHDMSKFYPSEFWHYMNWFSDEDTIKLRAKPEVTEEENRYLDRLKKKFNYAWLSHKNRNKHHWEHWLLQNGEAVVALEMPEQYAMEMVCDWIGAGIAITGKRDVISWYENNKHKMILHANTRELVENIIKKEGIQHVIEKS